MLHHAWGKFAFDENGRLCRLSEAEVQALRDRAFGRLMQDAVAFEIEIREYIIAHYGDDEEGSVLTENILTRYTAKVLQESVGKAKEDVMIAFIAKCEVLRPQLFGDSDYFEGGERDVG